MTPDVPCVCGQAAAEHVGQSPPLAFVQKNQQGQQDAQDGDDGFQNDDENGYRVPSE